MKLRPIAALAIVGVALLYGRTLGYGFDLDDYHFVHAYSWREVGRAFLGTWDASGIEAPFYRPLTVLFFAGRSWLFGTNAGAMHGLSLGLLALTATLFGAWLRATGYRLGAVLLGEALLIAHPVMSLSGVTWITNQIHLLQMVLILSAFLVATRGPRRWPIVLGLYGLALLVKEDSIMLAPAIWLLWRARGERIPRPALVATAGVCVGFLVVRTMALRGLGGYGGPGPALEFLALGPLAVLFLVGFLKDGIAAVALTGLGAFAILTRRGSARAMTLPAAYLLLFDLPLALASQVHRWHLLTLCLAAAVAGAVQMVDRSHARAVAVAVAVLVIVRAASISWVVTTESAPCARAIRGEDREAAGWGQAIDPTMRRILQAKDAVCGPV